MPLVFLGEQSGILIAHDLPVAAAKNELALPEIALCENPFAFVASLLNNDIADHGGLLTRQCNIKRELRAWRHAGWHCNHHPPSPALKAHWNMVQSPHTFRKERPMRVLETRVYRGPNPYGYRP